MDGFMKYAFPSSLPDFKLTSSLVFQLTLRLGSYPYKFDTTENLDFDALSRAMLLALGRIDDQICSYILNESEDCLKARMLRKQRRILFQSLVISPSIDVQSRNEEGDEDLLDVYQLVQNWNKYRSSNMKIVHDRT
jgi:uncharacterized protein YfkK (UPF0435 family)